MNAFWVFLIALFIASAVAGVPGISLVMVSGGSYLMLSFFAGKSKEKK